MSDEAERVDETGTLVRDGGGFVLRRDQGGRWLLNLHRVPVDHVQKRVRVVGVMSGENVVDVEGVAPVE